MLIDTHCHLTDKKFTDIDGVINRAKEAGVKKMIIPGIDYYDQKGLLVNEGVCGLIGIYPGEVDKVRDLIEEVSIIKKVIASNKKILGIGEIGLDCYWNKRNIERQRLFFRSQLELAVEMNLPVVMHNREAEEEIMGVLKNMSKIPRGQFHCWSGSEKFLKWVLDRDFYVSFAGNLTYKSAENLRGLFKKIPIERLLLETDSPYLAPEPVRGTRNEPKNVKILAEFQARLLGLPTEAFIAETYKNAQCLFSGI